jgi:adenylylsulfate kinase
MDLSHGTLQSGFYREIVVMTKSNKNNGCVLWLTGLPASGKSTLAEEVCKILESKGLAVEHLDGDKVREVFPQTGFDRAARDEHIRRVGFLASRLERHGVVVVASFISPYQESRDSVRGMCKNFYEIYLNTPLEVCKSRDPKGLYRKAMEGKITNFTGIQEPYEPPLHPQLVLDTSKLSISQARDQILALLS